MEDFIKAFIEIHDSNEMVDHDELVAYCRKKNLNPNQVSEWMEKFDKDEDGYISLDEFCRGLGLNAQEMRIEKVQINKELAGKVPTMDPDVQIITSKLNKQAEVDIIEQYKEYLLEAKQNHNSDMAFVAAQMKLYLDKVYDREWQIIIVQGSFWMNFSHTPFKSIQFKHGKNACLFWRTSKG